MPDGTDNRIGARLREVRKRRGMTQRGLADASGVSVSLIRKLEQGEVQDTRLETARRLAVALRIPTSQLVRRDSPSAAAAVADQWEPVRRALAAPLPAPEMDEEPTAAGVADALRAAQPLFAQDRFADLAALLPPLLRDVDALTDTGPIARAVRVRLMQLTGWLLTQARQYDAADTALERALADAGDRLDGAATVNTMCFLLLRKGRLAEARELATRWADDIEPRMSRATPAELGAWGWLLLRLSAASVRDNRPGEAEDALKFAHSAAVAVGHEFAPREDFLRTFGPTTVVLKRTENAMIVDRPDRVLQLASRVPRGGLRPTSSNRNRHLLDVANAHVRTRQYGDAVEALQRIRGTSPEWLPNQQYARDILGRVIGKRRSLTPEMRELADAIGMPM